MSTDPRSWIAALGERRIWLEIVAAVLVVVAAAAVVVGRAGARRADLAERAETLTALAEVEDRWRAGFVEPTPAESTAWLRSRRRVEDHRVRATDRVALAQVVAQRAEEMGIPDVAVGFTGTDELTPPAARTVNQWTFAMAPYAVTVTFTADYPAVVGFVGSLPPQVQVRRLELNGGETGLELRALLTVSRATGGSDGTD